MDELLVESLGLTKECDAFQSYSQLQICLLSFFDTFIIDNSMRGIEDQHRGLLTVISLTQESLEEVGSDKLPTLPWDSGVHSASSVMSPLWDIITGQRFMMTRVARLMLERVQGYLRGIVGSILYR
jgi:hypothetical protein